jgi:hypothetical protein
MVIVKLFFKTIRQVLKQVPGVPAGGKNTAQDDILPPPPRKEKSGGNGKAFLQAK